MALPEEFEAEMTAAVEEVIESEKPEEEESASDTEQAEGATGDHEEEKEGDAGDKDTEVAGEDREESEEEEGISGGSEEAGESAVTDQPEISDYAISQAVLAGMSVGDALIFPSEEALLRVVAHVTDAKQKAVEVKGKDVAKGGDPLAGFPEIDPESFEPEVVKMFDGLKSVIQKQQESIDEFRASQQAVVEAGQQAATREVTEWFDKQVNNLGEDFAEALGTGGYGDLPRGSSQLAKRDQVAKQVAVMLAGYQASGFDPPPREEVFDAAAKLVLHDEFARINEKDLSGKLSKRSKQHVQRAGGQKAKNTLTPVEEAAADIDAKYFVP